ncbi:MAG: nicotinate-nucleotide adenylyltransferase [candidate division KSB1 bacterium]|nr:nicotinate-nucleotide adenylyltransferase [candidate division KSB1 bacterium]MDZ7365726.1 nicotinate-nucleotide adenylyltransferase [candidate division KSB1 bacterium]MDZ7403794.1 nicotinate-nucleotide adenylyltransferase [candidate division KSB1 bacterium]
MRIGLYGGTFDPVHLGHLIVAEQARLELQLQRVFFVLTPNPPHKPAVTISPVTHRLNMLKLALSDHPQFEISTVELERPGVSYTVDTLRRFRAMPELAGAEFFLIIGADSMLELKNWREPQAITHLAKLAVYLRPGLDLTRVEQEFLQQTHVIGGPQVEISATDIRERCGRGVSIRYLVPESVRNYIFENGLYQT